MPPTDMRLLKLRPAGMFSNVNEVVEQMRRAETGQYCFAIDWSTSCYRNLQRPGDPWSYYFDPCFPGLNTEFTDLPVLPGGRVVACSRDNIITPRLQDGQSNPLLLPRDRTAAHAVLQRAIRPNAKVKAEAQRFFSENFGGPVIGLHLRGPGRLDGGSQELRQKYGLKPGQVPVEIYFSQVDQGLIAQPEARIFACSDSSMVINQITERYGDRVITYPAQRSAFGEMHTNHSANQGKTFSPYLLGRDVLVEALLLARTNLFVHGNSNVANFVLCQAPHLAHAYVQA